MCQKSNRQAEIWQREDNQRALVSLVAFLDPVFPNYWNLDHLSILSAGPGKKEKKGRNCEKTHVYFGGFFINTTGRYSLSK